MDGRRQDTHWDALRTGQTSPGLERKTKSSQIPANPIPAPGITLGALSKWWEDAVSPPLLPLSHLGLFLEFLAGLEHLQEKQSSFFLLFPSVTPGCCPEQFSSLSIQPRMAGSIWAAFTLESFPGVIRDKINQSMNDSFPAGTAWTSCIPLLGINEFCLFLAPPQFPPTSLQTFPSPSQALEGASEEPAGLHKPLSSSGPCPRHGSHGWDGRGEQDRFSGAHLPPGCSEAGTDVGLGVIIPLQL